MPRITISYRRDDSLDIVGRIFDRLAGHFGRDAVFRDIDSIPPGADFRRHIDRVLAESNIVLAVVGPHWIGPDDEWRRLASPTDPVRLEIETALRLDKPLIPVLVSRAVMPHPEALPDSLHDFAYRNAIQIDSGQDFDIHVDRLIRWMEGILEPTPKAEPPITTTVRHRTAERRAAEAREGAAREQAERDAPEIIEEIKRRDAKRGHPLLRAVGLATARTLRTLLWAIGLALARTLRTLLWAIGLAIARTLRWAIGPGRLRRAVILYFVIGLGLLAYGFSQPGPCPTPNTSIGGNLYFVATWSVGFYQDVYSGRYAVNFWTRQQACYGGWR